MKKISWSGIIVPLFFPLLLVGLIAFLVKAMPGGKPDYLLVYLGGLILLLFGGWAQSAASRYAGFTYKFNLLRIVMTTLGIPALVISLLGSMILILAAGLAPHLNKAAFLLPYYFAACGYYLFWSIFVWNLLEVSSDRMIIFKNGTVLYPGEKLTVYPWFDYKYKVFPARRRINATFLELACRDGNIKGDFSGVVSADLEKRKADGIRTISTETPSETHIKEWALSEFKAYAESVTVAEFCNKKLPKISWTIEGISFTLTSVEFSIVIKV